MELQIFDPALIDKVAKLRTIAWFILGTLAVLYLWAVNEGWSLIHELPIFKEAWQNFATLIILAIINLYLVPIFSRFSGL